MKRLVLGAAGVALLAAAVVLAWLAFTQFAPPPANADAAAFAEFEREQMRDARVSAALGVGASIALLGALACGNLARQAPTEDEPGDASTTPAGPQR